MKVISLSGGRSSAMMLKIMLDNNQVSENDLVAFCNTGREDEATLVFVNECAKRWGVNVVWLEYRHEEPKFEVVNFETASRKDNPRPFDELLDNRRYLPNPTQRICTAEMKIKTIRRYVRTVLKHRGAIDTYLGLRFDEPLRVARKKEQNAEGKEPEYCYMPLNDLRVTIRERDEFWSRQGFDLAISSHHDNCDFCFMKPFSAHISRIRRDPESVQWWIQKEQNIMGKKRPRNGRFRKEYSFSDLLEFAQRQQQLPFNYDENNPFQHNNHSLTCNCTD